MHSQPRHASSTPAKRVDEPCPSSSSSTVARVRHSSEQPLLTERTSEDSTEGEPTDEMAWSDLRVGGRESGSTDKSNLTRMGMLRAYWLGAVVCLGGFLCMLIFENVPLLAMLIPCFI